MAPQRQTFGGKRFQLRSPSSNTDYDNTNKRMIWKECRMEIKRHWFYLVLIGLFLVTIITLQPSTTMNSSGKPTSSSSLLRATIDHDNQNDKILTNEQLLNFNGLNTLNHGDNISKPRQNGQSDNDNLSNIESNLDNPSNQKEQETLMKVLLASINKEQKQDKQTNQENFLDNNNYINESNENSNPMVGGAEATPIVPDPETIQTSSPRCTSGFVADTTLKVLNVKGCGFQSLPPNLCRLVPNLQELDISFNPGIVWEDAALDHCPNLLVFKANGIITQDEIQLQQHQRKLPQVISDLSALTHLEWRFNGLTHISIQSLPFNLQYAAFSFNQITTILPSENGNLDSSSPPPLHTLLLSHNQLTNLDGIMNLKELRILRMAHNSIVFNENDEENYESLWTQMQQNFPNLAWISFAGDSFLTKKKMTKTMLQTDNKPPSYLSLPVLVPTIGTNQLSPAPNTNEYHYFQGKPVQVQILDSQSTYYQFFNFHPQNSNNHNNSRDKSLSLHIDGSSIQEELKIHKAIGMHGTINHHHVRGCMAILSKDGVVFPASIPTQDENYILLSFNPLLDYLNGSNGYSNKGNQNKNDNVANGLNLITIQQAWSVLQQVAIALTFLHTDVGIIYGNLCLENIMLVQPLQMQQDHHELVVVLAGSMEYAFPFPKDNNPVLQQIEVRSYGHLIEELLEYIEPSSNSVNEQVKEDQQMWKQPFQQLKMRCISSDLSSFLEILTEYFASNDNNSILLSNMFSPIDNSDHDSENSINKDVINETSAPNEFVENENNNINKNVGFNQNDIANVVQNMNNQPKQQHQP